MSHTQIEILGARERRRRWSLDQKLKIVAETSEPGASVRAVAARHDVYPSLLHTWRRQARRGELVAEPAMPAAAGACGGGAISHGRRGEHDRLCCNGNDRDQP